MTDAGPTPLLRMRGIEKRFGANTVLRGIDFDVRAGEVHALLGENGAGKSTLMKVLMGVHRADAGEVLLDGLPLTDHSVGGQLSRGIVMIFQELSLLPNLDVAANIFIGREPRRKLWRIDRAGLTQQARAIIAEHGFPLQPSTLVRDLPFAQRQMVEILKALSRGARVLIMDEPTSSLSVREEAHLFQVIADLRQRGIGIVYISHRMAEVFRVADRISIVKDGSLIGPLQPDQTSIAGIARLMSRGTSRSGGARTVQGPGRPPALIVRGLTTSRKLAGLDFAVGAGEVVGVAGLVGSGRSTLAKSLFGLIRDARGDVSLGGRRLTLRSPAAAIAAGVGYVPEDRRLEGIFPTHGLSHNVVLASLDRLTRSPLLPPPRRVRNGAIFRTWQERLGIASRGADQRAGELSGGNQQKIVFARWLATQPKLLVLDEPTNGVDLNAKSDMRAIVREAALSGVAVLLISSELDELTMAADRILVMAEGRITRTLIGLHDEADLRAMLSQDVAMVRRDLAA